MPEQTELGRFALGIRVVANTDGKARYQLQSANHNVPVEIIVMQLKAFLNSLEKEYFDNLNPPLGAIPRTM